MPRPRWVAAFTDTYLPTVNGVTYTLATWRDYFRRRGGRMALVYPAANGYDPGPDDHPVRSVEFPFYDGYRVSAPTIPGTLDDPDLVHAHTPFGVGLAGLRLARRDDRPLVASYHTPTPEYAGYLTPTARLERAVRRACRGYERWFFSTADHVCCPSDHTRRYLEDDVGVDAPVSVVSNGVDVDRFRPVDPAAFLRRHGIDGRPLIGYTGRHGHEKNLKELIEAVAGLETGTLVLGGDGPARSELAARARDLDVDARFLGFLDREELPAFYSALDVFGFPSPVETQGLVALEAAACGTPVVAVDAGALAEVVEEGETGYRYPEGDIDAFRAAIHRTLEEYDRLRERCLARRDSIGVERSIDRLCEIYGGLA